MNFAVGLYVVLGLALALLGFAKRPRAMGELVYPRFVVPLLFWLLAIFPAAFFYYVDPPNQTYASFRLAYQEKALAYTLLCFAMFWVGFRFRLRLPRVERLVHGISVQFDYPRIQRAAIFIATATGIFVISAHGEALWNGHDTLQMAGIPGYLARYIVPVLNVLAAIAFGFGWPEKGEPRRSLVWIGAIYVLFLGTLPLAANFSRGSGLFPMFMVLGYIGRFRKIPWFTFALAAFLVIYGAQVGLYGRGIYGHSGGFIAYMTCFFSGAQFTLLSASERVMAGEALTPLSVMFAADAAHTHMQAVSPLQWIYFQVPVPHMFGIGGKYTLDPTLFLGGTGSWGYTATMYGDTFAHFGWWGCLAFIYMGMLYRFLEELISGESMGSSGTLAFLTLPVAYYAFLMGTFNTYRSWNSVFSFGIPIVLVSMWVYAKLKNSREMDLPVGPPVVEGAPEQELQRA